MTRNAKTPSRQANLCSLTPSAAVLSELSLRDRLLNLPGETAYVLAMRPREECFEVVNDAVRATLEEISDPEWTAAQVAAAGIVSKSGDHDNEEDDIAEET